MFLLFAFEVNSHNLVFKVDSNNFQHELGLHCFGFWVGNYNHEILEQPLRTALIYKHFNTVGGAKLLLLLRMAFLPYRMGRGENYTKPLPY